MVTGRGFFPGKGGRRGFPMIGDEFAYFPHDKPFHDFGPYPNFPPGPMGDAGFFPPGPMGFMGHPPGIFHFFILYFLTFVFNIRTDMMGSYIVYLSVVYSMSRWAPSKHGPAATYAWTWNGRTSSRTSWWYSALRPSYAPLWTPWWPVTSSTSSWRFISALFYIK